MKLSPPPTVSSCHGSCRNVTIRRRGATLVLGGRARNKPPRRALLPFTAFDLALLADPIRAQATWANAEPTLFVQTHCHRMRTPRDHEDWQDWAHDAGLSGRTLSQQPVDSDELQADSRYRFRIWAQLQPEFNTLPGGGWKHSPAIYADLDIEAEVPPPQQLAPLDPVTLTHQGANTWQITWAPSPFQPFEAPSAQLWAREDELSSWYYQGTIAFLQGLVRSYGQGSGTIACEGHWLKIQIHSELEGWEPSPTVEVIAERQE